MNSIKKNQFLAISDPRVNLDMIRVGAEQVIQRLRNISASIGPESNASQFYVRMRAKEEDSIVQKVSIQQRGGYGGAKPNYSFRDVTDYAGLRFVTLHDEQIITAVNFVCSIVQAAQSVEQPIFDERNAWEHNFREASFITRRVEDSQDIYRTTANILRELVSNQFGRGESRTKKRVVSRIVTQDRHGNYSSAHLLFFANSYNLGQLIQIPLEIQIRTAVEDIWSEINHKRVYKVSSEYLWTEKFNLAILQADEKSKGIKQNFDDISRVIEEISENSRTAQYHLEGFWDHSHSLTSPGGETGRNAKAIHTSLCFTLYCFIGEMNADDYEVFSDVADFVSEMRAKITDTNLVPELARKSKQKLKFLLETLDARRAKLEEHRRNFYDNQEIRAIYNSKKDLSSSIEATEQRKKLISLEILKIDIFVILEMKSEAGVSYGEAEFGFKAKSSASLDKRRFVVVRELYLRLCAFVDDNKMKVRPLCMIFFWKYLLSQEINHNLAVRNVRASYEELGRDKSLPPWSIYNVVVPRVLALQIFNEAKFVLQNFDSNRITDNTMLSLRSEIKDKLIGALILAEEAFASSRDRNDRRGDIHVGFSQKEDIVDSLLVINICSFYFEYFNQHIFEGREGSKGFVLRCCEILESFHFRGRAGGGGIRKFRKTNIVRDESKDISIDNGRGLLARFEAYVSIVIKGFKD